MGEDLKSKKNGCKWWLPSSNCKPSEVNAEDWGYNFIYKNFDLPFTDERSKENFKNYSDKEKEELRTKHIQCVKNLKYENTGSWWNGSIPKSCGPYLIIDSNNLPPIKSSTSYYDKKSFGAMYSPVAIILCISLLVILFSRRLMKQRELKKEALTEQDRNVQKTIEMPPQVHNEKTEQPDINQSQDKYSSFTIGGIALTVLVVFFGISSRTFIKQMGIDPAMAPLVYGVILFFTVASFFTIKYLINSQFFKDYLSSIIMRLWVAASASWLLVLCCYVLFFDPFGYRIDSREQAFLVKLIFAPPSLLFLIGIIFNVALNKKTN